MAIAVADIVHYSTQVSLTGYSGNLEVTNKNLAYSPDNLLWFPIALSLSSTVTSSGIGDATCFGGTSKVLRGAISGVTDTREIASKRLSVSISSFFDQYNQRAINTQRYLDNASNILADLLGEYAGIPSALYLVSLTTDRVIFGIVSGNDVMEEIAKVAQATHAVVYTQKTGTLTVENWKDEDSAVDLVLPPEAIKEASIQKSTTKLPSRIVVRGRYLSEAEAGEQVLTGPQFDPTSANLTRDPGDHAYRHRCTFNGLGAARMGVTLANLPAKKEDLDNAAIQVQEACLSDSSGDNVRQKLGGAFRKAHVVKDGKISIELEEDCAGYMEAGTRTRKFKVVGKRKKTIEFNDPDQENPNLRKGDKLTKKLMKGLSKLARRPASAANYTTGQIADPNRTADEPSNSRMEMIVYDPDLVNEFGIVDEQIDNVYISNFEDLFEIAIRRFKEAKMERKTWTVEAVYLPCLSLYDVVTFTAPNGTTVTGLVTDIHVNYNAHPISAQMTFSVQSFEDLGATTYSSGNLLKYPQLQGFNGTDWVANQYALPLNGYTVLLVGGLVYQTILTEPGYDYTVNYTAQYHSLGQLSISMGGSSAVLSSTASGSFSFTAGASTATLVFSSTGNWFITFVSVVKEKVS